MTARGNAGALRIGALLLVVAAAGVLAASAVPHSVTQTTQFAPDEQPEAVAPTQTSTPTVPPASPGAQTSIREYQTPTTVQNRPDGPLFGPPERIKSAEEKAIEALLTSDPDAPDIERTKAALTSIATRATSQALAKADTLNSQAARKLVQWYAYRRINSGASAQVIERLRNENPTWPENKLLRQRAEEALLLNGATPNMIRMFFEVSPPQTPSGEVAFAIVELHNGKTKQAHERIRKAWRNGKFGTTIESRILGRFGNVITQKDIKWRLDQHLLDDNRYGRTGRLATIRRMINRLGPEEAEKARARLVVWRGYRSRSKRRLNAALRAIGVIEKKKAAAKIALPVRKPSPALKETFGPPENNALSSSVASAPVSQQDKPASPKPETISPSFPTTAVIDWPYEYHRIQLLRRQGRHQDAWRRLLAAPSDTDLITAPDHWWEERRVNIFNALYRKSYQVAYNLAAKPGDLGANARNQANFMAGWIAFRFLGDLERAQEHFDAFIQSADGPRTRAQSNYWLGRVFDVMGKADNAIESYERAAREFSTFYGQLAQQKLDPDRVELKFPARPALTHDQIRAATDSDLLQALRFAHLSGRRDVTRRLLRAIGKSKQTPNIYHLSAEFAKVTGDTQMALRIGKGAIFHGVALTDHAYPTHAFPVFKPLITPPEPAMLYGLARQESEFNTVIKSIVGARGVLQVMPATAHGICREHGLRCGTRRALTRRLSRDPSYNATLASAYVSGRLQEFGGSYILTYAGYNAGPGRARYWIEKSGDPRDPTVDPVDWIELIHLEETREYVKKVMANLQIYRARLGKPETALQITKDIERGTF